MRIIVVNDLSDLESDLRKIPAEAKLDMTEVVRKNVESGERYAKGFARAASGPHGSAYYKRITSEMTGPLQGEYGPHDGGVPVGAGWRHGAGNSDLPRSADLIGPKFGRDVERLPDRWFW